MADEMSIELEDGELAPSSVVSGPSSAAADVQLRAQLREATTVLRRRGQTDLARLALGLVDADLRDVMWVLTDQVRGGGDFSGDPLLFDAFRHTIRMRLLNLSQEAGYDDDEVGEAFPAMVLEAAQYAARLVQAYDIGDTLGGAVVVPPASAAAVRSLEKQTFRAATTAGGEEEDDDGVTECGICLDEFVDGGEVSVMPCPSRREHKFHSDCIYKWLAISNVCPLCRHELPAYYE